MSTAKPTGATAINAARQRGSFLACAAATARLTSTATTATACVTSSAYCETGWECGPVSGHALLNGWAVSGSVARITAATTVSAAETRRMPNLAASLATTSSTRPQASHNGTSRSADSWTARNVTGPKPRANPRLCAASAMVRPRTATVQTTK